MFELKVGNFKIQCGEEEALISHKDKLVCNLPLNRLNAALCGFLQQQGYHAFNLLEEHKENVPIKFMPECCPDCGCSVLACAVNVTEDGDTSDIYGAWPAYVYCINCKKSLGSIAMQMNFLEPYVFIERIDK